MPGKVTTALLSVSDKTDLGPFARGLAQLGIRLLSTGGSAKLLRDLGLQVMDVGQYTGYPEMLDGRVKTLHPKVHGGILARRDVPAHLKTLEQAAIVTIDLVVVNLYPFRETVAKPECTLPEAVEMIDIGGPAMIRSAAKNHASVGVVTDPEDYGRILLELQNNNRSLQSATLRQLAHKAFCHTARYDGAIADYLGRQENPQEIFGQSQHLAYDRMQSLSYGENAHQQAAFYRQAGSAISGLTQAVQLHGKALSYNNLADADAAWQCASTLHELHPNQKLCVIVKHHNPCGIALADKLATAYQRAFQCDSQSAFGGILAFNGEVDEETARLVTGQFVEVVIAPAFSQEALNIFTSKSALRVLQVPMRSTWPSVELRGIPGGLLAQTPDRFCANRESCRVATQRQPSDEEWRDLFFAEQVAKYVKSNAIVFCAQESTVGIGAGQMSRVDSVAIAVDKARRANLPLQGSVVASEAFFPFRDNVDLIAATGAVAIIQPGGSIRDTEVIAAADEKNIAMVFSGLRHFRH